MKIKELEKEAKRARTALDLTAQEWQDFHPGEISDGLQLHESAQAKKRSQQAWRVARRAAQMLRKQFGAGRVVVFGSLAHGAWFTSWSDIDLAAWGIPPERFYWAVAAVTGLSADFKIDLIDQETCRSAVRKALEREGVEL